MNLKKIKKKEKKEPTPKVKQLSQKKANRIVLVGASLLCLAATTGVIRSNVVAMNYDQLVNKVEKMDKNSHKIVEEKATFDSAALAFYATSFAEEYFNYDTSANDDEKKDRLERLANYLSLDVEMVDETGNEQLDFTRRFKQAQVVRIQEEAECLLVYVNVAYEVKQAEKTTAGMQEMVLPIQAKDQLFSIVSRPYLLATNKLQGKTDKLEPAEEKVELPIDEKKEIEKFLNMFFEKYVSSDKEELMLLMRELIPTPEGLEFVSIDTNEITYFDTKQKGVFGVQVSVTFVDQITKAMHTEDFSLWLTQTENSYFVKTIKHYFTEKEGN